ncbi:unnamed protein product [Moneuplotes crassus]|uniref:Uncharacterized protein n=1 Tax=Euplotes crassus TaxID=5936 RepID=A0AAD1XN33_EUPCR|nr:unnamed protein product [Moneuplotes crassus]
MFRKRIIPLAGATALAYYGLYVPGSGVYRHFIREPHDLIQRYGQDSWAIVTGGSDGIGKAFAYELANKGFNLLLISRTESKLQDITKDIEDKYKVKAKYLAKNFDDSHEESFYKDIIEETQDLDVSLLVNNVGIGFRVAEDGNQIKNDLNALKVNCCSQTALTAHFAPVMNKRKMKSGIVNLSSFQGGKPCGLNPVYSSTKGYNDFHSRASSWDYEGKIDFMSLRPSYVSTPLVGNRKVSGFTISAQDCARGSLDKLGHDAWTNGHWKHALFYHMCYLIPDTLFQRKSLSWRSK